MDRINEVLTDIFRITLRWMIGANETYQTLWAIKAAIEKLPANEYSIMIERKQ